MFIERQLDTAYGQIRIAIVRAAQIAVEGTPVIRDTKFHTHLHFWRQEDGTYAVREQDRPNMSRSYTDGMKVSDFSKPAPPTYFAKVLSEYTTVLNAFMRSNSGLANQAESEDIEREIGTAEAKVQEARDKLAEAQGLLDNLRAKRRKFKATVAA